MRLSTVDVRCVPKKKRNSENHRKMKLRWLSAQDDLSVLMMDSEHLPVVHLEILLWTELLWRRHRIWTALSKFNDSINPRICDWNFWVYNRLSILCCQLEPLMSRSLQWRHYCTLQSKNILLHVLVFVFLDLTCVLLRSRKGQGIHLSRLSRHGWKWRIRRLLGVFMIWSFSYV